MKPPDWLTDEGTRCYVVPETAEEVELWECPACGHPHAPCELLWTDPPACKECSATEVKFKITTRRVWVDCSMYAGSILRFISKDGQRWDVRRDDA